jgi:uncharacterized damage-inducible protein DinB
MTDADFLQRCVAHLRDEYLPRLERALEVLPEEDLEWQPHPGALSVDNVLRHLEGNVRQWILSGLGGRPDARERPGEFAPLAAGRAADSFARLAATVHEACDVVAALDRERLAAAVTIQGFETTGLGAVLHVVEHFSWHTGQAVWIAKARAGEHHGLAFFDDEKLAASPKRDT